MPTLEQVLKQNPQTVKLVYKSFPLSRHTFARKAATAVLAADRQGKFWKFHDMIFENYNKLNDKLINQLAQNLGMNMSEFNRDMQKKEIQDLINRDINEGKVSGVRGTPTIFVNGTRLKDRSVQGFQSVIEAELQRMKK